MASERASQQAFVGVSALLFAASAALTTRWCASMSAMGEMPMPGGWTMSMAVAAAAIAVERLAPAGERVARAMGPSPSGQDCFWSCEQPGSDDASACGPGALHGQTPITALAATDNLAAGQTRAAASPTPRYACGCRS